MAQPQNIVIIGGGIVGVSTAYFLTRSKALPEGCKVTLVEGTDVAAGASGYAGGFLAKGEEWFDEGIRDLAAMSFDLHRSLAEEMGGEDKWGYRALDTYRVDIDPNTPTTSTSPPPITWLPHAHTFHQKGTRDTSAQCDPALLTRYLCSRFLSHPDASLVIGKAVRVTRSHDGVVTRRTINGVSEEATLTCDTLLMATGPWLGKLAGELFGEDVGSQLAVGGSQANSIILRPQPQHQGEVRANAVFARIEMGGEDRENEPEVYCRPDGTVYICGTAGPEPLPDNPAQMMFSQKGLDKLHAEARALGPILQDAEVVREGACYWPKAERGRPFVGRVKGVGEGISRIGRTKKEERIALSDPGLPGLGTEFGGSCSDRERARSWRR